MVGFEDVAWNFCIRLDVSMNIYICIGLDGSGMSLTGADWLKCQAEANQSDFGSDIPHRRRGIRGILAAEPTA